MNIEFIYDRDCPNVAAARAQILHALVRSGLPVRWREWDRQAPDSPPHVRAYGSPTILVNGKDISGAAPTDGADCCRLYQKSDGGLAGVPEVGDIAKALLESRPMGKHPAAVRQAWRESFAVLPAIGVALLPELACPACWPAYAAILSALGLGFINYTPLLLPLTVLFLLMSVGSLFLAARRHGPGGPLACGAAGAAAVMAGKFAWNSDPVMFGGLALLVGASLWNAWLARKTRYCACADDSGKKAC